MTRQEALQTLQVYTKSPNLIRHHLAVEAAMRAIGQTLLNRGSLGINLDDWALAGLLHDADYELTRNTPEKHTLYLKERIGKVLPPEVMHAICAHNFSYTKVEPVSLMDWALYTCDELTGIIIACALVSRKKQLFDVTIEFVLKKLQEKSFAKSVDRNQIMLCEVKLDIPIAEYIEIVLQAMQSISIDLGFENR